jgi:ribosomal protein S18 acetylase RimI-like enzyme
MTLIPMTCCVYASAQPPNICITSPHTQTELTGIIVIQIRIANKEDISAITALHAQSWRLTYQGIFTDQYLQNELNKNLYENWEKILNQHDPNQLVIVAVDSDAPDELLGLCCAFGKFEAEGGTLIENLHTHPDHKNSGIGRQLFSHIARWSGHRYPGKCIHLWVAAQNSLAIGFYKHLGGVEDERSFWETPDGKRVPSIRFTWDKPSQK